MPGRIGQVIYRIGGDPEAMDLGAVQIEDRPVVQRVPKLEFGTCGAGDW